MSDPFEGLRAAVPAVMIQVRALRDALTRVPNPGALAFQGLLAGARRNVAIELGGAISEYAIGLSRPGRAVARTVVDEGRRARAHQQATEARNQATALIDQVQRLVSSGLASPIDWRFHRHINSELAKARTAKRPVTILDRLEGLLNEISAYSPPEDDISVIRRVDASFRELIADCMAKITPEWWVSRIPATIRLRAERAVRSAGSPRGHPIQFLNFGDYLAVIVEDANWRDVFRPVLVDKERFERDFKRLRELRNDVAHSRVLSTSDRLELRQLAHGILPNSY